MIAYDTGEWGVSFIWQLTGSVFPKALRWALPNALLAILCHYFLNDTDVLSSIGLSSGKGSSSAEDGPTLLGMYNVEKIWGSYTFVLGFLIVFRNNQAYSRFWQGANELAEIRGTWFDGVSLLFVFCNPSQDMLEKVNSFQGLLAKLSSLLFMSALQQICQLEDDQLEVLDLSGIDPDRIDFLKEAHEPVEVVMQWIQHLVVEADSDNVLSVAPPILSRVFQELSNGMVRLHAVKCIEDVPFPFPYAQMITGMLLVHWIVTPLFASQIVESAWWAGILCFCVSCAFWSLIYIALEIDQPFGEDANDLPVKEMMRNWNASLNMLLKPEMQSRPDYVHKPTRALSCVSLGQDFSFDDAMRRVSARASISLDPNSSQAKKMQRTLALQQIFEDLEEGEGECAEELEKVSNTMDRENSPGFSETLSGAGTPKRMASPGDDGKQFADHRDLLPEFDMNEDHENEKDCDAASQTSGEERVPVPRKTRRGVFSKNKEPLQLAKEEMRAQQVGENHSRAIPPSAEQGENRRIDHGTSRPRRSRTPHDVFVVADSVEIRNL
eukprot:TRINITY_DN16375_c0_g1_i2.p1 TRINITY_DN16375_c0_g1~~TRINITY_DN16375_c0_g1_i2.p1  ORF type:complete len:573 (+),score=80.89 TRINITY_DN16375_c0_g1_i2:65-1720(+)